MVSVIVPVHNTLPFLDDCFGSILGQDTPVELIIVDDGSSDGSEDVCRRYASKPGVQLVQTPHVGLSGARNAGIAAASGEYVSFVDSDDMLMPGALSALLGLLERHPGCLIAVGQFTRDYNRVSRRSEEFEADAPQAIANTFYQKKYFHNSAWGKLYRRSLFDECERFAVGHWYEDLEILTRLYMAAQRVAYTTRTVYYYRPNPGSFLNKITPGRRDMLWATSRVLEDTAKLCPAAESAARSRRFSSLFNMFNLAAVTNDEATARECFKEICGLRGKVLTDPNVRPKNKLGALLSCLGFRLCLTIGRHS